MQIRSQKPYLIRAIWQWCTDNGLTPHIEVVESKALLVPPGIIQSGRVVLNIGLNAVNQLEICEEAISFQARFSGVVHNLMVPIANILSIYSREIGHGMEFVFSPEELEKSDLKILSLGKDQINKSHDDEHNAAVAPNLKLIDKPQNKDSEANLPATDVEKISPQKSKTTKKTTSHLKRIK